MVVELLRCSLDRLVMIYKNVTLQEYDDFITKLHQHQESYYPKTVVSAKMSSSISAYRYNLNFGFGEGAIRVDYRHNTIAEMDAKSCDMRIEFNPNKIDYQNYELDIEDISTERIYMELKKGTCDGELGEKIKFEPNKKFFEILNTHFNKEGDDYKSKVTGLYYGHVRLIKEIDVAFDFDAPIEKFIVKSLTGKEHSKYKGTHYWGNKHTQGYVKMYDKKKERKNQEYQEYEHVTRWEYTMRFENCRVTELERIKDFEIRKDYLVSVIDERDLEKVDATTKAYLLCHLHGLMEFKEMSRRYQEKTKKALEELNNLDIDSILNKTFKKEILKTILNYVRL